MSMSYAIRFGTNGWRDRMDGGFSEENVLRALHAIAAYSKKTYGKGTVIIGFDARNHSLEYAHLAYDMFTSQGFDAMMTDSPTPTPVLEFSVKDKGAVCGVEITASHNPAVYNGIKFIPGYGAPASKAITDEIERMVPFHAGVPRHAEPKTFSPKAEYLNAIKGKIDLGKVSSLRVVVDPFYGTTIGYLSEALAQDGVKVEQIHSNYDPDFGGMNPEPNEESTAELAKKVLETGADIGIANDGDGDRFVAIDGKGAFYPSNKACLIIAEYLFGTKRKTGRVAKTVAVTAALDRLCEAYGVPVTEVPVGSKYISQELMDGAVLGVESTAGVSFGWWLPDRDGIAAGMLLCEIMANTGKPLDTLWQEAASKYGYGVYEELEFPLQQKLEVNMDFLVKEDSRSEFGGAQITGRSKIDGIKFLLDDGAWVLIRRSGTEPLVRVYIEAATKSRADELIVAVKRILGL